MNKILSVEEVEALRRFAVEYPYRPSITGVKVLALIESHERLRGWLPETWPAVTVQLPAWEEVSFQTLIDRANEHANSTIARTLAEEGCEPEVIEVGPMVEACDDSDGSESD